MSSPATEFVLAHYGDCTVEDIDVLARPGRWSAADAVEILRGSLARSALVLEDQEQEVIEWARRDVPELRSATDRTTPADLYRRVGTSAVGESMFQSGRAGAVQMGYGDELANVAEWRVERFVGLGCLWRPGLPAPDDRVLDLGSGAGVDLAIAHAAVQPAGLALGVDRLPYLAAYGPVCAVGRVVLANAVACPMRPEWATMAVANGLPPLLGPRSAAGVLREVHRVLAPSGALRFTTLVVGSDLPMDTLGDADIVDSVRCSKPVCPQYRTALAAIGFAAVEIDDAPSPFVAGYRAGPVRAVLVSARRV